MKRSRRVGAIHRQVRAHSWPEIPSANGIQIAWRREIRIFNGSSKFRAILHDKLKEQEFDRVKKCHLNFPQDSPHRHLARVIRSALSLTIVHKIHYVKESPVKKRQFSPGSGFPFFEQY
jgi:hypothetical protein